MHKASRIGIGVPGVGRAKSILAGGSSVPTNSPMTAVYPDEAPLSAISEKTDPDEALKQAFLAGSDEAFLELYAKYEHSLFYYCKRMMHNEAAAEDAFQEIWTRIFEQRGKKNSHIDHFRGLLFSSARNLCLNALRGELHEDSIEDRMGEGEEPMEFILTEPMTRAASGREIQALMVRALTKLPFDQRETFVLHEYSGFSFGEIAEMMSVPEANVKVRAHRARARLRKFIQGWLGLGEDDDPSNFI
jgi:RNA polymerase sigma-70 factor (ECF subfamily)